jgi:outer membrane receptor protein involved in Fe transport
MYKLRPITVATWLAYLYIAPLAYADGDQIEEIVVTATKRDEKLQEVPVAISAITSQQVQTLGIQRVEDYISLVPGFAIRDHGSPGYGTVILRGLNTGDFQSTATVAYYFDNTPFTATGSLSYGAFVTPDPDISDIARIEVLKGPQGTLYGASSLGGLVRLISKTPVLNEFSGSITVDGSAISGGSEGYGLHGTINVPIGDTAALHVSAVGRHLPGYIDNVYTGKNNRNDGDTYGGRADLLWNPISDLSIELVGLYQDTKTNGLDYTLAKSDTRDPLYGYYKDYSAFDKGVETKYTTFSGNVDYKLGPGSIIADVSYAKYDVDTFIDFTQAYGYILTLPFVLGLQPGTFATPTYGAITMNKNSEELRYVSEKIGRFEFIVGAFHTYEDTNFGVSVPIVTVPGLQPFPPPLDNLDSGITFGHYKETAGYGNLTFYLLDNLDFTAGLRYSENDQVYSQSAGVAILVPTPERELPRVTGNDTTYLATLRWRPTDRINTYLRAASGYRPGGPGVSTAPGAPTEYKPDTVWNYEAGIKASNSDNSFSGNFAIYHIDWKNVQIDLYDANGLPYTNNGGTAKVDGVEFDLTYRPVSGLSLGLNGAYTNARITEAVPSATAATGATPGDALPLTPKYTAALFGDYTIPVGADKRMLFGGTVRYQGNKHSSYPGSPSDPDVEIPPYTQFDVRGGLNIGRVNILLRCDNVFDVKGITTISSYKVLGNPDSPTWITYVRPRTFSMSVGTSF